MKIIKALLMLLAVFLSGILAMPFLSVMAWLIGNDKVNRIADEMGEALHAKIKADLETQKSPD